MFQAYKQCVALRHEKARAFQGEVERVRTRGDSEETGEGVWVEADEEKEFTDAA